MSPRKGLKASFRRMKRKCRRSLIKANKLRYYPIYAGLLFLLLWALLLPDSFSDFIWRYFWGPVVADATGEPVDWIKEGYNPVNTIAYGLLLVAAAYYGWKSMKKRNIRFDAALLISLSPLILVGALSRVLEDASAYPLPAAYFFISPIIYLWIGFLAVFFLLFSGFLEKREEYEALVLCSIPYPFALKFLWYFMENRISGYDLVFFILLTLLFMSFHIFKVKKDGYEMVSSVFLYSMYILSVFVYYATITFSSVPNAELIPEVLAIAFLVSASVGFLSRYRLIPSYFSDNLNIALVFSFGLDGAATWLGISYYGYGEKHVLTGILTESFGGLSFFLCKILLSILIIYILDVPLKKSLKDENLSNLIKFIIIFLALGPGLRDVLRVSLGV